jgi:hypothetical protein
MDCETPDSLVPLTSYASCVTQSVWKPRSSLGSALGGEATYETTVFRRMRVRRMTASEVVASYKKLGEEAFRSLKTVQLEVRPVYHKTDDRIRSHVFLCTLAYYLQWHLKQRLEPLFAADGTHKIDNGQCAT